MVRFLLGIFRDLYMVLLIILLIDLINGSDLLHDTTRKGVIAVTVIIVFSKVLHPLLGDSSGGAVSWSARRKKKTGGGRNEVLEWTTSEMQGWRPAMEDATCVVASMPPPLSGRALFAVFDGHGGSQVSLIASREFPKVLTACFEALSRTEGSPEATEGEPELTHPPPTTEGDTAAAERGARAAGAASSPDASRSLAPEALSTAMLTMDAFLRKGGAGGAARAAAGPLRGMAGQLESAEKSNAFNFMGSTAIVVLVDCGPDASRRPQRLWVANCGDSRAVLCRKGRAVELSEDHKPELPGEERRIKKAGGHVAMAGPCYRVDGWGLNLSRALGDFHYKSRADLPADQQKVVAVPEVRTLELTGDDEFIILGCDGIFELHSSQDAVDVVRRSLEAGSSLEQAAENLVDKSCSSDLAATRGKGGDNCSAVVVRIKA